MLVDSQIIPIHLDLTTKSGAKLQITNSKYLTNLQDNTFQTKHIHYSHSFHTFMCKITKNTASIKFECYNKTFYRESTSILKE